MKHFTALLFALSVALSSSVVWGKEYKGSNGNDVLNGNDGDDTLDGGDGDDLLVGGAGNDSIWGDDGDDTVVLPAGYDFINGDDAYAYYSNGTYTVKIAHDVENIEFIDE